MTSGPYVARAASSLVVQIGDRASDLAVCVERMTGIEPAL